MNGDIKHYYSIASEGSLVTAQEYLTTLDSAELSRMIVETLPNCDVTIKVDEKLYDPNMLRMICKKRLYGNGVDVHLSKKVGKQSGYKHTIYSTYSSLNSIEYTFLKILERISDLLPNSLFISKQRDVFLPRP